MLIKLLQNEVNQIEDEIEKLQIKLENKRQQLKQKCLELEPHKYTKCASCSDIVLRESLLEYEDDYGQHHITCSKCHDSIFYYR